MKVQVKLTISEGPSLSCEATAFHFCPAVSSGGESRRLLSSSLGVRRTETSVLTEDEGTVWNSCWEWVMVSIVGGI